MKKILFFFFIFIFSPQNIYSIQKSQRLLTLMLDPLGDAQHTGRIIEDTTERGLTLAFAQELKKHLEAQHKNVRIILTRFPGETLEPLQNALFANTLGADFYLSILFFWQKYGPSSLYLYHFLYNPVTDFWQTINNDRFIRYNQAFYFHLASSQEYGTMMFKSLESDSQHYDYKAEGFYGIPFLPLIGVISPSTSLEIGLKNKDDWQRFIEPVAHSLEPIINSLKEKHGI